MLHIEIVGTGSARAPTKRVKRTTPRCEANLAKDARQGQAEFNRRSWVARPLIEHPPQTQHSICGSRNRYWATTRRDRMRTRISAPSSTCISFAHAQALTARAAPGRRTEPRHRARAASLPAPWSGARRRDESPRRLKASARLPPEPISARCGWPRRRSCPAATGRGSSARAA
jgi:hypothetical protein